MSGQVREPKLLYRHADKDEQEGNADDPGDDEGSDDIRRRLEVGEPEDAVEHQQDGNLRPGKVVGVKDLRDNQEFRHHDNVVHRDLLNVNSHAILEHACDKPNNGDVP